MNTLAISIRVRTSRRKIGGEKLTPTFFPFLFSPLFFPLFFSLSPPLFFSFFFFSLFFSNPRQTENRGSCERSIIQLSVVQRQLSVTTRLLEYYPMREFDINGDENTPG